MATRSETTDTRSAQPIRFGRGDVLFSILLLLALGFLFAPGLLKSEIPAFRDAYHFYYPQAVWLDQAFQQGELFPQWNRFEVLGTSVPAQGSTALYYPLRFLWWIPGLTLAQRFSLYIVVHLLIAAAGAAVAAKWLGLRRESIRLAAVAYGLGCPVFFQHTNLIYLTSAAWIAWAVAGMILYCLSKSNRQSAVLVACAAAMMVLGGDIHNAVNTLVVATVVCLGATITSRADRRSATLWFARLGWIASVSILVAAMTWMQWIPTLRAATQSGRISAATHSDSPPSVSEHREIATKLQPSARHYVYDFSLSPWHLLTTLWPNVGGHFLPSHSRWFSAIPAEGRMWLPSIFLGSLTLLLCCCRACCRSIPPNRLRAWKWLAVLALLAALGNYSAVWLLRELFSAAGMTTWASALPKDHVSSVYWLITNLVPGYSSFRYPAKWTVWFAAAAVLWAALKLNHLSEDSAWRHRGRLAMWFLVASGAGLVSCIALRSFDLVDLESRLAGSHDAWLGAPQVDTVLAQMTWAFAIPLVSLGLIRWSNLSLSYLTLAELTVACWCLQSFVAAPSQLPAAELQSGERPILVWADIGNAQFAWPPSIEDSSKPSFVAAQCDHQKAWLLSKLNHCAGIGSLHASQSVSPAQIVALKSYLRRLDSGKRQARAVEKPLRQLGCSHRLAQTETGDWKWLPIADPAPLCELYSIEGERVSTPSIGSVRWNWMTNSRLAIELETDANAILLIRQFHDGGWRIVSTDSSDAEWQIPAGPALMLEVPVPAGKHTIELQRRFLW